MIAFSSADQLRLARGSAKRAPLQPLSALCEHRTCSCGRRAPRCFCQAGTDGRTSSRDQRGTLSPAKGVDKIAFIAVAGVSLAPSSKESELSTTTCDIF
ncbi:hypothetical protein NDU88_002109 [Pleurodeles waltl]|uniref:Uncharacterized protein n=1 Tax=Pleurodeles waltl TaxID=8319 RepID=A0AAV7KT90_PLEWA|nr:hypothetical protein NDU88_002109 [Pleurodeles waltl]